ncbi:MAG: flavin reductase [Coprobacillus sp.]|nr:flavin reductase [Coprobacillus sp.]
MAMKEIKIEDFHFDGYSLFGEKWPLLGCGNEEKYNAMTISWGHYGSLWGHMGGASSVVVYVRDTRYTHELMDNNDYFTLSILPESCKDALSYMGSHTGRNRDKIHDAGLSPAFIDHHLYIQEAEVVLVCRKVYRDHLKEEGFVDKEVLDEYYPKRDLHSVYIGLIEKVLVKE